MLQNQNYTGTKERIGDSLNTRAEIEKYLNYWKWFILGILISMGGAYLYLRYSNPEYKAITTILIKDNQKSGLSAELGAFKDLGIVGGESLNNPDNEIEILQSRKIISNVIDTLGLNLSYYVSGRVVQTEVYKSSSPIHIKFLEKDFSFSEIDTSFTINVVDRSSYNILDVEGNKISSHAFGEIVRSDMGDFICTLENKIEKYNDNNVLVKITPTKSLIGAYRGKIGISIVNKNSSVLSLTLENPVRKKAEDFLNELVRQYNIDAVNDKSLGAKKTKEFIDERLKKVKSELFEIDERVKDFKKDKDFTGIPAEVELAFQSLKETNKQIIEIQTQSSLGDWIEAILKEESKTDKLLPSGLGFQDESILGLVFKYNKLVSQKKQIAVNAGKSNPAFIQLEEEIIRERSNILKSLSNMTSLLNLKLDELKKEQEKVLSKVRSIPSNERGFVDIARQQEIISGLYQYLLRKKEETDISLAVTVSNAKIIDLAYSYGAPVSPKKQIIYIGGFILGILIPFIIIYILDLLDVKVHNKNDIESELSVPFLGDIPKSDSKEKIIIGNDIRSSTAEAFRLVRTNLDFMLASNRKQSKAIFVTSTTSGEGKSFISINLAATLALSGKKVLLMGMDLRAPKVTEYMGIPQRKGVTNYITDMDMSLEDLIFNIPQIKGLDIIASGVIPPNPAELLMTKRIDNLFTIVKQEYDIVLVDTAPVNLVTDTLLIGKYADMFMYVVRANYLDKRLLAVPQELYNEKKLPNMAIILNDTDPKRSYGYGYGGYGYGYVVIEKPWYKKIFSKDS